MNLDSLSYIREEVWEKICKWSWDKKIYLLEPMERMASPEGPINAILEALTMSAKSAFSDKKP